MCHKYGWKQHLHFITSSRYLVDEGAKISLFCLSNALCLGDTKSVKLFLSFQSFLNSAKIAILGSQWKRSFMRSGMSWLRVYRSLVCPSLLLSLPPSVSPSPFSLPSQLLFPSLQPYLPAFHLPPSPAQSLTHFHRPFLCLCHFPVSPCLCPLIPSTVSPCLRFCLALFPLFSLPTPLAPLFPHSTNSPVTFHFLIVFLLVYLLRRQLSLFHFFFQRHDATNGETYEGWKRIKSCQSRWFNCDSFSFSCKFHAIYQAKTKRFLNTRSQNLSVVHTTLTTVTSPWFD